MTKARNEHLNYLSDRLEQGVEDGVVELTGRTEGAKHHISERWLCNRYADGEVALHIHGTYGGQRGVEVPPTDFCAVFECPSSHGATTKPTPPGSGSWRIKGIPSRMYRTVLVDYVESVQFVEDRREARDLGVGSPNRLATSIVRLQLLDSCLLARPEQPDSLSSVIAELAQIREDRKHDNPLLPIGQSASLPESSKLIGEVVQGGAEIVNTVSDNQPPIRIGGREVVDIERVTEGFEVSFIGDFVRIFLKESGDLRLEQLKMSLGPPELRFAPVQWMTHG